MSKQLDKMLKVSKIGFYGMMMFSILIATVYLINTDWESVADSFSESTQQLVQATHCTINYEDYRNEVFFTFNGMCTDKETVLNFINDSVIVNKLSSDTVVIGKWTE